MTLLPENGRPTGRSEPVGIGPRGTLAVLPGPVLGIHGIEDTVSAFERAREHYASTPSAVLIGTAGGRHDALNDATRRTAAATIVLFLERLRIGAAVPLIAHPQQLASTRG